MSYLTIPRSLRTFALIWFGQLISSLGSGLTAFGLSVYLFQETGSAAQFALNSFLYVVAISLVASLVGTLVDRWDRRWVLILADTGQALATFAVALLLYTDQLAVWHIYTLTIIQAILGAFHSGAYEASVALLVPKQHLTRAAGMRQFSRAVTDLVTPALAGFLVITIGLEKVVLIDLATFGIAILVLLAVHIPQPELAGPRSASKRSLWGDITFGWHYLFKQPGLLGVNMVSFIHDFLVNSTLVLTVPMLLSSAGADEAGIVLAMGGAGLLLGSGLISAWGGPERRIPLYLSAIAFDGVALMITGWSSYFLLVGLGRFLFFLGFSAYATSLRATLQSKVAPQVQGRVFGAIGTISMLTEAPAYPVGGFLADRVFEPLMMGNGWLASLFGPLIGVGPGRGMGLLHILMGFCLIITALVAYLHPRIRLFEAELPEVGPDELAVAN